jgi:tetratricopeptide (TPR) repeat protein
MTMEQHNGTPRAASPDGMSGALEEYLAAAEAGTAPPREEFLARHPELADDLDACLDALRLIGQAAPGPLSAAGALAPDGEPAPGVLGDFRIIREVGRGGMGVVYEAQQLSLGRRVALKVLPFAATMDSRQLQRFHNEARAAASLDHPHIVHVHAVGCERAVHFYAMQFIDGQTLAALIADQRRAVGRPAPAEQQPTTTHVPGRPAADTAERAAISTERAPADRAYFRRAAEWGIQAAEALDHAHQLGIVHRDVKPANLLVDGRGGLWVTDFGLAHMQSDARLTMTGDLVGTLRYMSPEQALAKRVVVDHRTDIYSLGATLYELLTLEPAFAGSDRQELLRQIAFEEPAPPRRISKAIPAELETIALKALEKNPAERYATARDLADDLRRFLKDEPIRARPAGAVRRLRKWARRHRALVWAAALVGVIAVLFAGGTGVVWANQRAAVEAAADTALRQADTFQEQGKWPEALASARHAEVLVNAGSAGQGLRGRVRRRRADLEMVARVEEIRMLTSPTYDPKDTTRELNYDVAMRDQSYEAAFREYGVDVTALAPADAGARLGATTVPLALAAALDDWALVCKHTRKSGDTTWKNLLAAARVADPDEWRNKVRDALEADPVDRKALMDLASSERAVDQPPSTLVRIAAALRSSGAVAEALAFLRTAQRRYPVDFWLNKKLAEVCGEEGHGLKEEDVRFATAAWVLRPESASATNDLGGALMEKGALDEAVLVYRQAIRLKPDWAELHDNLGIALSRKGSLDEAIAAYKEAIRLKPEFAVAWRNLGGALVDNGDLDEAVAACREAIRLKPDFAGAYLNLGYALREKGQMDEAIAACGKAADLNPKDPNYHYSLGVVLSHKGRQDDAIAEFRKAVGLKPQDAAFRHSLGAALREKGDVDGAIEEYRASIRLNNAVASAHYNLANALDERGESAGAIAELHEALCIQPDYPEAHTNLANALKRKGDLDGAIAEYRKALATKQDFLEAYKAHAGLGHALAEHGRLKEAVAQYREAITRKPEVVEPHYNLGNALRELGRADEAVAEYREAIRLDEDYAEAHCNLGGTLLDHGRLREALTEFRRGHELGSKRPRWPYPSAKWVKECERFLELEPKLPAILSGMAQPADATERTEYAGLCHKKHLYAAAARLYREAIAAQPELGRSAARGVRYDAACAAARAGTGTGVDAARLTEAEQAALRKQALEWLRADLDVWRGTLEKQPGKSRPAVADNMRDWLRDPDFSGVRGPDALARLSEAERSEWRQLWADAQGLLDLAQARPAAAPGRKPQHED